MNTTLKQQIFNYIQNNKDEIFTAKNMIDKFGVKQGNVSGVLCKLVDEGHLMKTEQQYEKLGRKNKFYQATKQR